MLAGISDKNREILDKLNRIYSNKPFSINDVLNDCEMSIDNVRKILPYFARKGWLSRIKSGVYITVPLGTVSPESYKANPWVIANNIFYPCYIGGWSALEYWNLTEQIFNSTLVITGKKPEKKIRTLKSLNIF